MRRLPCPRLPIVILLLLATHVFAHEKYDSKRMNDAMASAQANVAAATDALNQQRAQHAQGRAPLSTELEQLTRDTQALRQTVAQQREAQRQSADMAKALQKDVEALQESHAYVVTLLAEYRRSLETRNSIAESQHLAPSLSQIDALFDLEHDTDAFGSGVDALLSLAATWNSQRFGGTTFEGSCLTEDGVEHSGQFAVIGPLVCFSASQDENAAGMVVTRTGSILPGLFSDLSNEDVSAIAQLVAGQRATVPFDPSGGDALKVDAQKPSLREHLSAGGVIMIPLILVALIAVTLTLAKTFALMRINLPADLDLDRIATHLSAGEYADAQKHINSLSAPFRSVLSAGVDYHNLPDGHLEEILQERALATLPTLDKHLGMLAVLGGVSPLLGLLGTVTGMIQTFEQVTVFGTGDARLLSGGISEALVTTEVGLVIAVPILMIHALLSRRVRTIVAALEQSVIGIMNRLHRTEPSP